MVIRLRPLGIDSARQSGARTCEPRSGERSIAWGVSPRYEVNGHQKGPEGRQICRRSAAHIHFWDRPNLGLTPQAMHMPPLRGWVDQ
jgi:hypothetical protein